MCPKGVVEAICIETSYAREGNGAYRALTIASKELPRFKTSLELYCVNLSTDDINEIFTFVQLLPESASSGLHRYTCLRLRPNAWPGFKMLDEH